VLQRAVQLGVNFIDTSDAYGPETNERSSRTRCTHTARARDRDQGRHRPPAPDRWTATAGRTPACGVRASLQRLRVERSTSTSCTPSTRRCRWKSRSGELGHLPTGGKIRHIGVSNFTSASSPGTPCRGRVSVQNRYSISDRSSDAVLAVLRARRPRVHTVVAVVTEPPRAARRRAREARGLGRAARRVVRAGCRCLAACRGRRRWCPSRERPGRITSRRMSRLPTFGSRTREVSAIG